LGGERIDIVRWNESLQVLIPNALQPAEIDEVMLCHLLGRAIVLVRDDQLSLAIGRRGQNVRLASKLVGWDIEIMTAEELDEVIEKAIKAFEKIEQVDTTLAEKLVEQGILSYDDLSVMEITDLVNTIEGLSEEQTVEIVRQAEILAEEQADDHPRRKGARTQQPSEEANSEEVVSSVADGEFLAEGRSDDISHAESGEPGATVITPQISDVSSDALTPALPTGEAESAADDVSPDADLEPENDEAIDDEIHDMALASETSNILHQGHEVTSPPGEEDQGENARIATEAVEEGGEPRFPPQPAPSSRPDESPSS
jgi:N utilization substance protein A